MLGFISSFSSHTKKSSKEIEGLRASLIRASEEKVYLQAQLNYEKEKSMLEFECLSNKLLKENSKEFAENSQLKIQELLSPLKQKIEIFQSSLQEISKAGAAERLTLKNNIEAITNSNKALAKETHLLARTLKGDVKKQGTCLGQTGRRSHTILLAKSPKIPMLPCSAFNTISKEK